MTLNAARIDPADASEVIPPWQMSLGDNTSAGPIFSCEYIATSFGNDRQRFVDRSEGHVDRIGFYISHPDAYEVRVYYSLLMHKWRDVFLRMESSWWMGPDLGSIRIGQGKVPLDMERNTASTQASFIENSSVSQVIYEHRRVGAQWSMARRHWRFDAGYYGNNLEGTNPGRTWAWHAALVPFHTEGGVLHAGVAASTEYPELTRRELVAADDRDDESFKAAPSIMLNPVSLVGTGSLADVARIQRRGLEGLWIAGPWSLQAEQMSARLTFTDGRPAYSMRGHYVFISWTLTGEARRYEEGVPLNPIPAHSAGALELVLRRSEVNLDQSPVLGGREQDWTGGANWYLGSHVRLQLDVTHSQAMRRDIILHPHVVEMMAQFYL